MSANSVQLQKPARPRNIVIIVVALGVIALLSAVGLLSTSFRSGRPAITPGNQPGNFQRANPQGGGSFQGGNNNPQSGNGNFQRGNGNFQQRGGLGIFSLFGATRSLGINFQYIRYVSLAIGFIGIVLTVVAAYFVWKQKRWALNLAIVLAILFLLGALPGLFTFGGRNINWLSSSTNILKALATLPIIVLGILPSVRDSVS
jgi:uncharacterized membrane protein (DUF2068 family)